MNGKSKCKLLKDIRRRIAAENDIAYVTSECKHKGDCLGTCPKCEQEVRYLEEQLRLRRKAGKTVAVAGLAAAMMVSATGCGAVPNQPEVLTGDVLVVTEAATENTEALPTEETLWNNISPEELMGEPTEPELAGRIAPTEVETLMGDIAVETDG